MLEKYFDCRANNDLKKGNVVEEGPLYLIRIGWGVELITKPGFTQVNFKT